MLFCFAFAQAYWPVNSEKETFDGVKVKRTDVEEGEVITTTLTVQDKVRTTFQVALYFVQLYVM